MRTSQRDQTITLALTGASGGRYGLRLMQVLLGMDIPLLVMLSAAARTVLAAPTCGWIAASAWIAWTTAPSC